MNLKEETVATLKRFDIGDKFSYLPVLPKASVLIPLFVRDLLSSRDPSDRDDVDTALREAQEEIGLPPDQVEVVCTLFPVFSKRGLLVSPVVGFIKETFTPTPNPSEVSAVFAVPLDFFTREKDHCITHGVAGMTGPLHSFYFRDPASGSQYHIFGLTAMLATLVAVLALKKKPQFDVGFDLVDPLAFFKKILHKRLSKL
uniref:Uncharacterized protein n=1 Tax=Xiphophorus couchianus TaxID=32473 RepID=A0A3B5MUA8_9TELE